MKGFANFLPGPLQEASTCAQVENTLQTRLSLTSDSRRAAPPRVPALSPQDPTFTLPPAHSLLKPLQVLCSSGPFLSRPPSLKNFASYRPDCRHATDGASRSHLCSRVRRVRFEHGGLLATTDSAWLGRHCRRSSEQTLSFPHQGTPFSCLPSSSDREKPESFVVPALWGARWQGFWKVLEGGGKTKVLYNYIRGYEPGQR